MRLRPYLPLEESPMPATLRNAGSQPTNSQPDARPEGYVEEHLHCNHENCDTNYVLGYHRDDLRAERAGDPADSQETLLKHMRTKANDIVANHPALAEARNYVWAGIEKGWVVVEDLTAAGI
jgi:hypothetical protein